MGKLHACLVVASAALAACGSDSKGKVDSGIVIHDTAIDTVAIDAPPDAPNYDFSCFGQAQPTTAADPISLAGTTQALSQSGAQAVATVLVEAYKTGTVAPIGTTTSAADGSFTVNALVTGGTPLDAYLKATKMGYRTTYLYPSNPVVASLMGVPVMLIDTTTFALLGGITGQTQDDSVNGLLAVAVTDCANTPIPGATLKVQQASADVGMQFNVGTLSPMAAGTYLVFNVPDGATQVFATYMGMTFPAHTVASHKQPTGANTVGTITATAVRPGP